MIWFLCLSWCVKRAVTGYVYCYASIFYLLMMYFGITYANIIILGLRKMATWEHNQKGFRKCDSTPPLRLQFVSFATRSTVEWSVFRNKMCTNVYENLLFQRKMFTYHSLAWSSSLSSSSSSCVNVFSATNSTTPNYFDRLPFWLDFNEVDFNRLGRWNHCRHTTYDLLIDEYRYLHKLTVCCHVRSQSSLSLLPFI